ncbi:MAG: class I SAM-dependent methyltransferase [Chitinophagales bacterium]|nr:class I SAM-dependent methyltransferase [Chitinophagales bacterium]
MYEYNQAFFTYIEIGAIRSATKIIPLVLEKLNIDSVLDVGCGRGAWLKVWSKYVDIVHGIDGNYVDTNKLHFNKEGFFIRDLRSHFTTGRKYSLVQCLEVAEHLPEHCASSFIKSLCSHSDLVLFSAAVPGQGGENHINEQPYYYWQNKFKNEGFIMLDPFRKKIMNDKDIEPWYRFNLFLFVKLEALENDFRELHQYSIPENDYPKDISPLHYKVRKFIIKALPLNISTFFARIKKYYIIFLTRILKTAKLNIC